MVYITVDEFVKKTVKNNPKDFKKDELTSNLKHVLDAKMNGVKCLTCNDEIWVVGSAIIGTNMCFTCITGEVDDSEDYEVF